MTDDRGRGGLAVAAPAGGRASAAPAVPASLVPPLGLGGHPRALPSAGSHPDACRSGERPRPGRPCSRRLSPRARRGARGVACIPGDRDGRRLSGFPAGGTLGSGTGGQLFRDERGRGADDLARDGCCLASSMSVSPEHGCLGDAGVLARNGVIGAEPLGGLPLGLGHAEPLAAGGLAAAPATVAGRTAGGLPLNRPTAGRVAASRPGTGLWRNHVSLLRFVMPRCWARQLPDRGILAIATDDEP